MDNYFTGNFYAASIQKFFKRHISKQLQENTQVVVNVEYETTFRSRSRDVI